MIHCKFLFLLLYGFCLLGALDTHAFGWWWWVDGIPRKYPHHHGFFFEQVVGVCGGSNNIEVHIHILWLDPLFLRIEGDAMESRHREGSPAQLCLLQQKAYVVRIS